MPLPSIASDIPLDQAGQIGAATPGAAAPLDLLDKIKLGFKQAGAQNDWGWNQHNYEVSSYHDIRSALVEKGYNLPPTPMLSSGDEADFYAAGYHPQQPWLAGPQASQRFDAFWSAFNDARAHDPNFAPAYKDVHDFGSLLDHVNAARRGTQDDVSLQAPDGLGFGGFVGQIGRAPLDPMSWIPLGGPALDAATTGGRILVHALAGAAINAGVTVGLEPLVQRDAANSGQQRGVGDFLTDLLASTAFGAVIGGGHEVIHLAPSAIRAGSFAGAARQADADAFGKALKGAVERADIPAGSPFASFDATVARAFSAVTTPDQRTPDEQAAIDAVERQTEVKASSPFVPSPAGDDAHVQQLERGMNAIHNPDQLPQRGPAKPIDRATVTGPDDVADTRTPGRELLKAKIHAVEAPHGGPNLAGGKALGPYQFEPQTWVNLFKRRYPNDARSFDEIAALREDPHLNDVLINDLISENAAALRHAGFDESAGNLYLAHVLGHDRAVTVLRADPNARLGDLLPEGYFKRNPFRPDDRAASLVHWAYGKMGDKSGLPVHVAEAPEAAQGAEAIGAGEADPQVQPSTGRFDVEALYGDVGMTDRPVLDPDHFASPEVHAVAQVRYERASDAADGFAPVMSRAEAFAPSDHFDAVRRYQGKVTPEAIGEALGLSPDEVRRVVGSMQATDANSPLVLTRGRPPKLDKMGNVTREGTEAGRVIRRPPKVVKPNETMLEYLTRTAGGLKDIDPITGKGGDLLSMGGQHWHETAPFRRKLIDNEGGQSLDDAFERAIDAGYFPEHSGHRLGGEDLPDLQDFRDAIDGELRGKPRYANAQVLDVHEAARRAMVDPEEEAAFHARQARQAAATRAERLLERTGHNQEAIDEAAGRAGIKLTDDQMVIDASDLIDGGMDPDEALGHAAIASAYRSLDDAARETGNSSYAIDPDERFAGDDGLPDQTGSDRGSGGETDAGGRGPEGDAGPAAEARDRLEQSAHDPKAGQFSDPIGAGAEAQADSVVHDLQMEASEPAWQRLRKEAFDQAIEDYAAANGMDFEDVFAAYDRAPDGSAMADVIEQRINEVMQERAHPAQAKYLRKADIRAIANENRAADELHNTTYRVDSEGGESDLAGILDEIEQAQRAVDEMRGCLKPKGGDE